MEEIDNALIILYDLTTADTHCIESAFIVDSNNAVISLIELGDYFRFAFLTKDDICVAIVERNSKMNLKDDYKLLLRGVSLDEETGEMTDEVDIFFKVKFFSHLPQNLVSFQLISKVSFYELYEII